jgi:hypothetical protein
LVVLQIGKAKDLSAPLRIASWDLTPCGLVEASSVCCLAYSSILKMEAKTQANFYRATKYWVFRAQADWTFILPLELPIKELCHLPRKMPMQAYQTSQYTEPRGGILLGKWRSTFTESSDSKMNVQSACALNTLYNKPEAGILHNHCCENLKSN